MAFYHEQSSDRCIEMHFYNLHSCRLESYQHQLKKDVLFVNPFALHHLILWTSQAYKKKPVTDQLSISKLNQASFMGHSTENYLHLKANIRFSTDTFIQFLLSKHVCYNNIVVIKRWEALSVSWHLSSHTSNLSRWT